MQKLLILLIFILLSCSYPNRDAQVENQIANQISLMSKEEEDINEITLNFNQLKPELTWDSLIIYGPYSSLDAEYNFRISLFSHIVDLNQADSYVAVGFLEKRKLTSYALIERNPDLLQVLPPNKPYVIYGRNEAMFNIKKNPR